MYKKLILASASPRRRELLEQIGAEFAVVPAKGEEVISATHPKEVVLELSGQKAREVAGRLEEEGILQPGEECVVIGADTVVAFEGQILGKPKDPAQAAEMLSMLQGHTHQVYTGVTLLQKGREGEVVHTFARETQVEMYPMSQQEIEGYVATRDPMDKAGAYGIQGMCARFIRGISGDYNNVVGLPVAEIYQCLKGLGIEISSRS